LVFRLLNADDQGRKKILVPVNIGSRRSEHHKTEGKAAVRFRRGIPLPLSVSRLVLLLFFAGLDRLNRTLLRAGSAVRAQLGIYGIFVLPLADRLYGTFILTGPTSNAFIGNDIRHIYFLLVSFFIFPTGSSDPVVSDGNY
jgi:hypothetical protein